MSLARLLALTIVLIAATPALALERTLPGGASGPVAADVLTPRKPGSTGDASGLCAKLPDSDVCRTMADRAAEATNVLDLGADKTGVLPSVAAINAAILLASQGTSAAEVRLPAGTYRINHAVGTLLARSGVTLRGAGMGRTVLMCDNRVTGGNCIGNQIGGGIGPEAYSALADFHLRDLTLRGYNDVVRTTGSQTIALGNCRNCSVEGVEVRNTRYMGIVFLHGDGVRIRGNRLFQIEADGIAAWDTRNLLITDNEMTSVNDDAISVHTNDDAPAPARSGILIANNTITESQGIRALGAKQIQITGNTLRRTMGEGITVGFSPDYDQGNTAPWGVVIANNIIADVMQRQETPARNGSRSYIWFDGGPRTRGSAAAAPGMPNGTGGIAPLYGSGVGSFYTNDNKPATNVGTPGGYWLDISNNLLIRTLPAVPAVSTWGNGGGLFTGSNGAARVYDGAIPEVAFDAVGIHLAGAICNSRVSGNTIQTTGSNAIEIVGSNGPLLDMDINGLTIERNKLIDFKAYGIFTPFAASYQRFVVRDNEFDGDPGFVASGRTVGGGWKSLVDPNRIPIGLYLGSTTGAVVTGNTFRNVFEPVTLGNVKAVLRGNIAAGQCSASGYSASNKGIGACPAVTTAFGYLTEDSEPASATFGKMLGSAFP